MLTYMQWDRLQVSNQMLSLTGSLKDHANPTSQTFGSATRPVPIAPGSQLARERATEAFASTSTAADRLAAPNAITNPPSNPNKSNIAKASSSNPATSASASSSKKRSKHKSSIGVDAASQAQVDQAEYEAVTRQPIHPEAKVDSTPGDAEVAKKRRKEDKKARKSVGTDVKAEESVSRKEKREKKRTATDADHGEEGGSKKKRKKD
jgi:hypothetical protein